ncbi:MAG: hypothetical protein LBP87_06805 [Planctomycetaceae bacterium]|jgi:hypothetical protein|nr:hypothetical protein [Planctomycetaceae bacterium]
MLKLESIIEIPKTDFFDQDDMPLNAVITSIHWGLIPYGLVLALDVPETESPNSPHYRLFIMFENIIKYELPLCGVDTLPGLFVDFFESELETNGKTIYSFVIMTNVINGNFSEMLKTMQVYATNARCFRTTRSVVPAERWLSYRETMELLSDEEFKEFLDNLDNNPQ